MKMCGTPGLRLDRVVWLVALMFLACVTRAGSQDTVESEAPHVPSAPPAVEAAEDGQAEDDENEDDLEVLGRTLKAAVMSGTVSEKDAIRIWMTMSRRLGAEKAGAAPNKRPEPPNAKDETLRLMPPRPAQVTVLLQPEFLRRDLAVLEQQLELDRSQRVIAEVLLADYLEAFDLAVAPYRDAMEQYRRASTDQWLVDTLARAQVEDLDAAVARTRQSIAEWKRAENEQVPPTDSGKSADESRVKNDANDEWTKRLVQATTRMESRLDALRERVQADLDALEQDGSVVSAEDLLRMARQLRDERLQLRTELIESLRLIVVLEPTDDANDRFDRAIARLRIERLLPAGRLGGERMNLWAALIDVERNHAEWPREVFSAAQQMLDERAVTLAAAFDQRTTASLDREMLGLEYQLARDRALATDAVDPTRIDGARRPFVGALRQEVMASITTRDTLLRLLDEAIATMQAAQPEAEVARVYRDAAWRRGFPVEARPRWAERAMATAMALISDDADAREVLALLESHLEFELRTLRTNSIAMRMKRDAALAIERVEAQYGGQGVEDFDWQPEHWLGVNYAAFDSLDEDMESRLRSVLTPEAFERLPRRGTGEGKGKGKGKESP